MAKMTEEAKRRLQEIQKKKRGVLLKDIKTSDITAICDLVKEKGLDVIEKITRSNNSVYNPRLSYLRYATREQVEVLKRELPHRDIRISAWFSDSGSREVSLFNHDGLLFLFTFLGVKEHDMREKYTYVFRYAGQMEGMHKDA